MWHVIQWLLGRAMRLVGNHTHFCAINCTRNSQNCTQLRLVQFLIQLFSNCTQMCVITYNNHRSLIKFTVAIYGAFHRQSHATYKILNS